MNNNPDPLSEIDLHLIVGGPCGGDRSTSPTAQALLERIVAAPRSAADHRLAPVPLGRRRRLVLVPLAAGAAGLLAVQALGGSDVAYASWTPEPSVAEGASVDAEVQACRQENDTAMDVDHARLVLAERRGDFVAVVLSTDDPDMSGQCVFYQPTDSEDLTMVSSGAGGADGPAFVPPAGAFTEGAISQGTDPGEQMISIVHGRVGLGVESLVLHTDVGPVRASVADGQYVAWWPGAALSGTVAPSGRDPMIVDVTYEVGLDDGTTVEEATPARPS